MDLLVVIACFIDLEKTGRNQLSPIIEILYGVKKMMNE